MTRLYSSGSICSNRAKTEVKATLTQTSIGPSSRSTWSAAASTAAASATSVGIDQGRPAQRLRPRLAAASSPASPRASSADLGPAAGEGLGAGAADPPAGAGHDDDLGLAAGVVGVHRSTVQQYVRPRNFYPVHLPRRGRLASDDFLAHTSPASRLGQGVARENDVDDVMRAARVLVGVIATSMAEVESTVTMSQFRVLVLADPGPINVSDVADALAACILRSRRPPVDLLVRGSTSCCGRESRRDRRQLELRRAPADTASSPGSWTADARRRCGSWPERTRDERLRTAFSAQGLRRGSAVEVAIGSAAGQAGQPCVVGGAVPVAVPVGPPVAARASRSLLRAHRTATARTTSRVGASLKPQAIAPPVCWSVSGADVPGRWAGGRTRWRSGSCWT